MDPWQPELHVTPELARQLIENQFPALRGSDISVLGSGWDNVVYFVASKFFFRFPQRAMAVDGVEREIAALPTFEKLNFPVPRIRFVGRPDEARSFPWPFFGYEPIPGKEVCETELTEEKRERLAEPLAHFLRELHSADMVSKLVFQLPEDPLGRMNFSRRVPMTLERLEKLERLKQPLQFEKLRLTLKAALNREKLPTTKVVHGDLHFRHLIVDQNANFSGLIDWGDIHLDDPATDLQIVWSFFPPKARNRFLLHYGPMSFEQLLQSRSFSVFMNVALLEYALAQNLEHVAREARWSLDNLLLD